MLRARVAPTNGLTQPPEVTASHLRVDSQVPAPFDLEPALANQVRKFFKPSNSADKGENV